MHASDAEREASRMLDYFCRCPGMFNGPNLAVVTCAAYKAKLLAQVAALTAERDALRAGLEWLRDKGVNATPSYIYLDGLLQPRADYWANLASACGRPELARYGTEPTAPADNSD